MSAFACTVRSVLPSELGKVGHDPYFKYLIHYVSSRPSTLRTHLVTHTRAKRTLPITPANRAPTDVFVTKAYRCIYDGCSRKYSTRSNMLRHLRTHDLGRGSSASAYEVERMQQARELRSPSHLTALPGAPMLPGANCSVFGIGLSTSLIDSRRLPPP